MIKINKILNYFLEINESNYVDLKKVVVRTNILQAVPKIIIETLVFLLLLISIFLISKSSNINVEPSILSIFFLSLMRIYPSWIKIIASIQDINLFKKSMQGVHAQINYNQNKQQIKFKKIEKFSDQISIKNLNFKFKTKKIFDDFEVSFKKNSFNAIIGSSGSGKSTFLKILLGLIEPQSINCIVDQKKFEINELANFITERVGFTGQNSLALNATLGENITLSKNYKSFDDEKKIKLKKCFNSAGLNNFFSFESELDKIIVEDGKNISGGQLQRVSLARALFFSKDILIFDEICSSLDIEAEREIIHILKEISKEYLTIYVTHRDNFFDSFDQIIKI